VAGAILIALSPVLVGLALLRRFPHYGMPTPLFGVLWVLSWFFVMVAALGAAGFVAETLGGNRVIAAASSMLLAPILLIALWLFSLWLGCNDVPSPFFHASCE
jgi:hypothetical protein